MYNSNIIFLLLCDVFHCYCLIQFWLSVGLRRTYHFHLSQTKPLFFPSVFNIKVNLLSGSLSGLILTLENLLDSEILDSGKFYPIILNWKSNNEFPFHLKNPTNFLRHHENTLKYSCNNTPNMYHIVKHLKHQLLNY